MLRLSYESSAREVCPTARVDLLSAGLLRGNAATELTANRLEATRVLGSDILNLDAASAAYRHHHNNHG